MSTEKNTPTPYTAEEKIDAFEKLLEYCATRNEHNKADLPAQLVDHCRKTRTAISAILPDNSIPELTVPSGFPGLKTSLSAMAQYAEVNEQVRALYQELLVGLTEHLEPIVAERLRTKADAFFWLNLDLQFIEVDPKKIASQTSRKAEEISTTDHRSKQSTHLMTSVVGVPATLIAGIALASEAAAAGNNELSFAIIMATVGSMVGLPNLTSAIATWRHGLVKNQAYAEAQASYEEELAKYPADKAIVEWNKTVGCTELSKIQDAAKVVEKLLQYIRMKNLRDQIASKVGQKQEIEESAQLDIEALVDTLQNVLKVQEEMSAFPSPLPASSPTQERTTAEREVDEDPLDRAKRALAAKRGQNV